MVDRVKGVGPDRLFRQNLSVYYATPIPQTAAAALKMFLLCFGFPVLPFRSWSYSVSRTDAAVLLCLPHLRGGHDTSQFFFVFFFHLFLCPFRFSLCQCIFFFFFGLTVPFQLLNKLWTQVSSLLPPGTFLQLLSRIGLSISTARRLSSNVANSRFRAFRESICAQEKAPTNLYEYALGGTRTHEIDL